MQQIDEDWVEKAVVGGAILGGGGGGDYKKAKEYAKLAIQFGEPVIKSIDSFSSDCILVTVSAVGAPSATDSHVPPSHYVKALSLINSRLDAEVVGTITNEMGGFGVINGLVQSAVLDVPMIDAACNGRAHPTGTMGSMGLTEVPDYVSHQVGVGGDKEAGRYVESYLSGSLVAISKVIRQAADQAGGLVAVARNPVSVEFVRENGAIGVRKQAFKLGEAFFTGDSGETRINRVVEKLDGEIVVDAKVTSVDLRYEGGFDVGEVKLGGYALTFWNEYMTLEADNNRLATFPDLIMTLDSETGMPVTSAEIETGQAITLITTSAENLHLGAGMRDEVLLREVEEVIGKDILNP